MNNLFNLIHNFNNPQVILALQTIKMCTKSELNPKTTKADENSTLTVRYLLLVPENPPK